MVYFLLRFSFFFLFFFSFSSFQEFALYFTKHLIEGWTLDCYRSLLFSSRVTGSPDRRIAGSQDRVGHIGAQG